MENLLAPGAPYHAIPDAEWQVVDTVMPQILTQRFRHVDALTPESVT
jgi:hypothetical protein